MRGRVTTTPKFQYYRPLISFLLFCWAMIPSFAWADSCGEKECSDSPSPPVESKNQINEISYEKLIAWQASGKKFILLDTRSKALYMVGHIKGAQSFPLSEIKVETTLNRLPKDFLIIVYCSSAMCHVSRDAARKLQDLGYAVVDYPGGVMEWTQKGNGLEK